MNLFIWRWFFFVCSFASLHILSLKKCLAKSKRAGAVVICSSTPVQRKKLGPRLRMTLLATMLFVFICLSLFYYDRIQQSQCSIPFCVCVLVSFSLCALGPVHNYYTDCDGEHMQVQVIISLLILRAATSKKTQRNCNRFQQWWKNMQMDTMHGAQIATSKINKFESACGPF